MPQEIKVKYEYSKDYRKIPATGAWGGLSPNGEVIVNFYVEFKTKPEYITLKVDEKGSVEREDYETGGEDTLTRELQMGVVLRPDIAESIGRFLIDFAKKSEETFVKSDKNDDQD